MDNRLPPGQRPLDRFPRFGTNQGPPPAVPTAPVIEITGAVEAPTTVAVADLPSLPRRTLIADFHCVAGWSARGLRWEGVPSPRSSDQHRRRRTCASPDSTDTGR